MIHDDQSSSSRMLSRAETDAINSILDEEEIRIGQFSSLSPNLSALDEQCKQIWSNWESIPASASKAYPNNNNDFNNSSPRISSNTKPTTQFGIYDSIPKRTEKYKLTTPTNNKANDFDDSINIMRYADKPKSNKYDEIFSSQNYSSPATQPRTFTTKFETTSRPPPSIDDITDFTKPSAFSKRSPSYQESRNIDPLKTFDTPIDSNPIRRGPTEFDYAIPSKAAMKSDLLENDVGNLKNELNSLMEKVRTASRSPTSLKLSPSHSDPFSGPPKERKYQPPSSSSAYSKAPTSSQAFENFSSPSYRSKNPTTFNPQERFTSPKASYTPMNNNFTSSSPKISSSRYTQNSYNIGLNDDSFMPPNSMSIHDDDTFAEPINVPFKPTVEPKLPPKNNIPSTNFNAVSSSAPNQDTSSPEILLLRQENVRLKAELLKVQKQLQAEHEEKENIKLSLVKCEQLRQRYKERLKMYEKQMGVQPQPQQQNK